MPWFRVDDNFYDHPKVDDLSLEAVGLWTLCGTYCAKQLTDGFIPARRVMKMGGHEGVIQELIHSGLWLAVEGGYQFHDWDAYQPTREKVERDREAARERQARKRRGDNGQYSSAHPEKSTRSHAVTSQELPAESPRESHHPDPSLPVPSLPKEETPSSDADAPDKGEGFSEDVIGLCDYLAQRVRENGNKAKVGKGWHQAMDRLMRLDGYTPDQVRQVIDWCQQDEFWQANIMSATKLREKFDMLKTRMFNDRNRSNVRHLSASERRLQQGRAMVQAALEEEEPDYRHPLEIQA